MTDSLREVWLLARLLTPEVNKSLVRPTLPMVVSMTSFPQRLGLAWISIETILRQSVLPQSFFLVLSVEEFEDRKVPFLIRRQTRRGLKILWVDKNGRSYDKLLPVLKRFPSLPVVTVDDDKYFPPTLLSQLWTSHKAFPNSIVGARGWRIRRGEDSQVRFGEGWERLNSLSVGHDLHLPGGNGNLYPPESLDPGVYRVNQAIAICPTTDDIWFWAHAFKHETHFVCLGLPAFRPVKFLRSTPSLSQENVSGENEQFEAVIAHLNVKEKLEEKVKSPNHP